MVFNDMDVRIVLFSCSRPGSLFNFKGTCCSFSMVYLGKGRGLEKGRKKVVGV